MPIRAATPADIPSMMHLASHASSAAHWSRAHYDRVFGTDAPRRAAWVVEDGSQGKGNALQGFLVAHEIAREWELENIVINEQFRRQGFATRLLLELINVARTEHASAIFLEVRESNHAARAFYQNRGFLETGRRPRYYSHPSEDAITYRLRLA
jgi:ribosomal-protein-alanine N-acetyltransferase